MFRSKSYFSALVVFAIAIRAQPFLGQDELPAQAKAVHGAAMPVPKEIFRSLDQFQGANWRSVQRSEITRWKSRGEQSQIASLLGIVIAEGFVATEAKDSAEVRKVGKTVLHLARGLGVEERALRRSRSIMELAESKDWGGARKEWDGVLADLENGMTRLKSAELTELVSLGGWLRGTEALCALVLQNYSAARAELIRQPALVDYLQQQLLAMRPELRSRPLPAAMLNGLRKISGLIEKNDGALTEQKVEEIQQTCADLVRLASRRLTELSP